MVVIVSFASLCGLEIMRKNHRGLRSYWWSCRNYILVAVSKEINRNSWKTQVQYRWSRKFTSLCKFWNIDIAKQTFRGLRSYRWSCRNYSRVAVSSEIRQNSWKHKINSGGHGVLHHLQVYKTLKLQERISEDCDVTGGRVETIFLSQFKRNQAKFLGNTWRFCIVCNFKKPWNYEHEFRRIAISLVVLSKLYSCLGFKKN